MRFILVIFLASSIFARPQSGRQSGPSSGRGFGSSDNDTEVLSIEVLETHDNYEIRKFPAAKWACTKENNVDPLADPMRNWEEKYDNNSMLAMSNYSEWKKTIPSSKMFKRIFRYILGVNQEAVEIEMTRPVPTSIIPVENNLVDEEMCFWLGTPYESEDAPQPIDKKVTIEEKPSMTFYASQFNGHMFSHQNWEEKYENLKNILLADDNIIPDTNVWYHIGYDSPWTPAEKRRNEIWIPISEAEADDTTTSSV